MNEILFVYCGGIFLGLIFWIFQIGDYATSKEKWFGFLVSTLGWPILLPYSFLALWINLSYGCLKFGLWLANLMKAEIELDGVKVEKKKGKRSIITV